MHSPIVGLLVGGLALLELVAWIWLVVRAFRAGGTGWGLTMLAVPLVLATASMVLASPVMGALFALSVPALGLAHVVRHDGDGKLPFLLTLPGTLAIAVLAVMSVMGIGGAGQPT